MSYDVLEKEIKTLPEQCYAELSDFIVYLKLKSKFSEFESRSSSYNDAVEKWRADSADLFKSKDDAEFMEHAFEKTGRVEGCLRSRIKPTKTPNAISK